MAVTHSFPMRTLSRSRAVHDRRRVLRTPLEREADRAAAVAALSARGARLAEKPSPPSAIRFRAHR